MSFTKTDKINDGNFGWRTEIRMPFPIASYSVSSIVTYGRSEAESLKLAIAELIAHSENRIRTQGSFK